MNTRLLFDPYFKISKKSYPNVEKMIRKKKKKRTSENENISKKPTVLLKIGNTNTTEECNVSIFITFNTQNNYETHKHFACSIILYFARIVQIQVSHNGKHVSVRDDF